MKKLVMALVSFMFIVGLALSSFAAREVIEGKAQKVDAMKGAITVTTQTGPREFKVQKPEKLKDIKEGDQVKVTVEENGDLAIERTK
jgi:Cu/Ag efflux protein CusF